jgi:methionyl-tRNA formyltransferase
MQWKGVSLKIHRAHVSPGQAAAGNHLVVERLPAVATSQGLIVFDELQPAGKKPMPGKDFLSGSRDWENG